MGKKKLPKASFPELEAMLEDMQELLTDEYGNPLPPDHPQVKKLQSLVSQFCLQCIAQLVERASHGSTI